MNEKLYWAGQDTIKNETVQYDIGEIVLMVRYGVVFSWQCATVAKAVMTYRGFPIGFHIRKRESPLKTNHNQANNHPYRMVLIVIGVFHWVVSCDGRKLTNQAARLKALCGVDGVSRSAPTGAPQCYGGIRDSACRRIVFAC